MNTYGENIKFSIFGESHGVGIGGVIDGIGAGEKIDFEKIDFLLKRRNHRASYSTQRSEPDKYEILSGIVDGVTTGAPIGFIIKNQDTKSNHYSVLSEIMRPSHSDYPAYVKYNGFNDVRGGGHFSGRITAPLVIAGGFTKDILSKKGVNIISHVIQIGDIKGESLLNKEIDDKLIEKLNSSYFPVLDDNLKEKFMEEIEKTRCDLNSVGGVVEVVITGLDAGCGEPFFSSVESRLASMLFSVPAVKGVEFGLGFDIASKKGYDANDFYYYDENKNVKTKTNNNGGILGGITNGMPIVLRVAIKPTASIFKEQETINVKTKENVKFSLEGRHDVCIVPRAAVVLECASALAIFDILKNN
ncbi:MAG: chorismate synthase [Ruminococcaceae bacterium]|nr:chorismate synthase [Oscillospiraceae bacterium]